ncbi:YopX family protein [Streptococcus cristatus]|uniref:YopX family protein n=1 Tax=Streptococcus cristatus TaxID=45634 RepID=UPI0039C47CC2
MKPKFRAWLKNDKEMIDADEIHWDRDRLDFIGDGITFMRKADEIELMQLTGLFDKNGKEIFEGDILEIQGIRMVVKFGNYEYIESSKSNEHTIGVVYDGLGFYVECINATDPDRISPFEPETLKESVVIGNIYESQELLEEEK